MTRIVAACDCLGLAAVAYYPLFVNCRVQTYYSINVHGGRSVIAVCNRGQGEREAKRLTNGSGIRDKRDSGISSFQLKI